MYTTHTALQPFMHTKKYSCCLKNRHRSLLNLHLHMSSFTPQRAPPQAVDDFLSSVYTASTPRNIFSISVTGGGSAVIADLFTVPGASNSLMQASVPYSHAALSELLGGPEHPQSCSKDTAILMAKAVFKQTVTHLLADNKGQFDILSEANIFGVAGTAALVSSRPKRGLHRCHVSSFSSHNRVRTWEVCFRKGLRTRREEDYACSRLILDAIAASCRLPALDHAYLSPGCNGNGQVQVSGEFKPEEEVEVEVVSEQETSTLESAFDDLFSAQSGMLLFTRKPAPATESSSSLSSPSPSSESESVFEQFSLLEDVALPPGVFVYPGSYNPLHAGHVSLAAAAMRLRSTATATSAEEEEAGDTATSAGAGAGAGVGTEAPLVFEISALNADKPPLTKEEILRRVSQFAKGSPMDTALREAGITNVAVCITSRPFFEGKAALFPECQFIMGADTLSRLFLPKYYNDSRDNMVASVSNIIQGHKCSFIIGGRKDSSEASGFCDLHSVLATVQLPDCVRRNLFGLTDEQFRFDISSTEIRNTMKK
jgi:hypothetical protein